MNTGVTTLRKRWPVLAAIVILMAVALAAGTLFAANERQQPEAQAQPQQSVADASAPDGAADLPGAPPPPERFPGQSNNNDEEEDDLPPIVKVPPAYPNLDSNLNRLAEQAQAAEQHPDTTGGSAPGSDPAPAAEPVLVTFYIEPEQVVRSASSTWRTTTCSSGTQAKTGLKPSCLRHCLPLLPNCPASSAWIP